MSTLKHRAGTSLLPSLPPTAPQPEALAGKHEDESFAMKAPA